MGKRANLIGQKFGRLTVIAFDSVRKSHSYWLTECECGTKKIIAAPNLKTGAIVSCKCFQKEQLAKVDRRQVRKNYESRRIDQRTTV